MTPYRPPCQGASYPSRRVAEDAAKAEALDRGTTPREAFDCPECGRFHLNRYVGRTSIPCRFCGTEVIPAHGAPPLEVETGRLHRTRHCDRVQRVCA